HTTVPAEIAREKIVELPWGAAIDRFEPYAMQKAREGDKEIRRRSEDTNRSLSPDLLISQSPTVVFLGSFRAWHGVLDFVRAALLLAEGRECHFLLIGDGAARAAGERAASARRQRFTFTGAVAYDEIAGLLERCTIGV